MRAEELATERYLSSFKMIDRGEVKEDGGSLTPHNLYKYVKRL
jgi:hypothetical protein